MACCDLGEGGDLDFPERQNCTQHLVKGLATKQPCEKKNNFQPPKGHTLSVVVPNQEKEASLAEQKEGNGFSDQPFLHSGQAGDGI